MADLCGAYWLIDAVMSYQYGKVARECFQVWTLTKNQYKSGKKKGRDYWLLTAQDGNDRVFVCQTIEYSDFPLDDIKMYLADKVLMLTSEY
jgi:hypothetical protein